MRKKVEYNLKEVYFTSLYFFTSFLSALSWRMNVLASLVPFLISYRMPFVDFLRFLAAFFLRFFGIYVQWFRYYKKRGEGLGDSVFYVGSSVGSFAGPLGLSQ